jgi:ABC-2 type transport system permease protein
MQVFLLDLRMNMKNFMGTYMLIVPLGILIVLRIFIPTVESTSVNLAVVTEGPHAVEAEMVQEIDVYADVQIFDSIEAMERKLRGAGSTEGLYYDPEAGQYVSVLEESPESNGAFSPGATIIRQVTLESEYADAPRILEFQSSVPPELADRTEISPVATMGGAIFVTFLMIIAAFFIGLGIVYDKEAGTDLAVRVSPVTRLEYFVGKSILPLVMLVVYPGIALGMLGLLGTDVVQVYAVVAASFLVTLFVGLLIGALAKNENEAMGLGKTLSTIMMLAILGGTLLPDGWQWIVYWVPVYWVYNMLETVFTATAEWGGIGYKSLILIATTAVYFTVMRRRIAKGLS